jgi:methionyl aminopeptidase
MTGRNDPCWCGSQKKWKKCHYPKRNPQQSFSEKQRYFQKTYGILLKTPEQIDGIRKASRLAAFILDELCKKAKKGVTTNELNDLANELHKKHDAIPAPLNYGHPPFPKSVCTSINEVICHGIPNDEPLREGDIINIDITSILNGYYGDCSRMVCIGKVSEERQLVVDVSYECLMRSIKILKPGVKVYEIGDAIVDYAHKHKCSVVYQFVGHGVGCTFHEAPQIPHHKNDVDIPLEAGMTFTIEPMINAGVASGTINKKDKWVATTDDKKASGQWEHTLLITETGCEILTVRP